MSIKHALPFITEWKDGRNVKVSHHWSIHDTTAPGPDERVPVRHVWHYGTHMLTYYKFGEQWTVDVVDLGHGGQSDQDGLNILIRPFGLYYARDRKGGGPRIMREVVAFPDPLPETSVSAETLEALQ